MGAAKVERADCLAESVERDDWSTLDVVIIGGGMGLGGLIVGLLVGVMGGR